ncbi:hypothetical protein [Thiothrix winogradskyi]|uniref:Uncharacterized protein n=1 Tax=Thiothrix winogradskyi TaxID=96472 RepID=A0ABY3SZV8_9GAMM|nr:hypothetical protein [Thiothrix winogradskyi]UJS25067.1 hypothetical protein L2Y54_03260 [Thiothrix winogradskyi]
MLNQRSQLDLFLLLEDALLAIGGYVDLYESKDSAFVPRYLGWLKQLEGKLRDNRVAKAAVVSSCRASILSVSGQVHRDKLSKRKQVANHAADTIQVLQQELLEVFTPLENKLARVRDMLRKLLVIYSALRPQGFALVQDIACLWQAMTELDELRGGVMELASQLPKHDLLRLLGEEVAGLS